MLVDTALNEPGCAEKWKTDNELRASLCKNINPIYKFCTNQMVEILASIFQHSIEVLVQNPPCDFLVIVLGSLARGEATPYSDVEYLFLVEKKMWNPSHILCTWL